MILLFDDHAACADQRNSLPFSNRASLVNALCLLPQLLPYRGHGSLRGRRKPLQHLVRSTGAAMSTTGSHLVRAAQRPPSQPACTLAPVGNPHIRAAAGCISMVLLRGLNLLVLGPAERLA